MKNNRASDNRDKYKKIISELEGYSKEIVRLVAELKSLGEEEDQSLQPGIPESEPAQGENQYIFISYERWNDLKRIANQRTIDFYSRDNATILRALFQSHRVYSGWNELLEEAFKEYRYPKEKYFPSNRGGGIPIEQLLEHSQRLVMLIARDVERLQTILKFGDEKKATSHVMEVLNLILEQEPAKVQERLHQFGFYL